MPAPTTANLYGPASDLWPERTPTRAQALAFDSDHKKIVNFSSAAIKAAINGFTDAQIEEGAAIFVNAGSAGGSGAGAGSTPWLADCGKKGLSKRILIMPLGLWGTCAITSSMKLQSVYGVAFGGFEFTAPVSEGLGRGMLLSDYTDSAIFNMGPMYYWGIQSLDNKPSSGIELVNIVLPDGVLKRYSNGNADTAAIRTGSNAPINGVLLQGLYEGPSFIEDPKPLNIAPRDEAHTDTRQISGGSILSNVRQRRSVTFGSTDAAIQSTGALTGYHFEDSLIIGGPSNQKRYPLPVGADAYKADGTGTTQPNALNGGPGGCTAKRLVVIGTVGSFDFVSQTDSWLSVAPASSQQPSTGPGWGVDTSLSTKPLSYFDTVAPIPTRARMKAIFDNATINPPTDPFPTAPSLGEPVVTTSTVALTWTASTDPQGPVTYDIERDGKIIANVSTLTWTNSALPVATTYTYQVFAVDNAGQRTGSNSRTVTTGSGTADTTPPSAPEATASNITLTSATISWTASTDNIGVTGYEVVSDGTVVRRLGASARSLSVSGLTPDTEYEATVVAFDAAGNRAGSNIVAVRTLGASDTTAPTAPTIAEPTVNVSSIAYSWAGATDNRAVTGYDLYLDNAKVGTTESPSYTATGLAPMSTHTFYVVARDEAGNSSDPSNTITSTTGNETNPPTLELLSPGEGVLPKQVAWRVQTADAESGIGSVEWFTAQGGALLGIGSDSGNDVWGFDTTDVDQLPELTQYVVRSVDQAGNETWSAARAVSKPTVAPPDTTPPTGGISDPVDGAIVVPPFSRVRLSASDPQSGISSVSLRSSTLGELVPASLVSPGIYEADLPVGALSYGENEVFARIVNGVGLSFDTAAVTLVREAPVASPSGRGLIAGPWLDGSFEPIKSGRLTFRQRVPFANDLGYITQAGVEVVVRDGKFYRNGVEGPVPVGFPPLDLGFEVDEEPDGAPPRLGLVKTFPDGTVDGQIVAYGDLVPLELEGLPAGAYVPIGVTETLAAAAQVAADKAYIEDTVAELNAQTLTVSALPNGYGRLTIGA